MILNMYDFVMKHETMKADVLFEKLEAAATGLFTDLTKMEGGPTYGKYALLYIIHAYSKESQLLVMGQQLGEQKKKIFEFLVLPVKMYNDLVHLSSPIVRDVVTAYLDYQEDRDWKHLIRDYEILDALTDGSVASIRNEKGEIDYVEINKTQKLRSEVHARVKEAEQHFREEYGFVSENRADIKKMSEAASKSQNLGVQGSSEIQSA